jgi:hypothetical protein
LVGELSSQKDEKWRIMGPRVVTRGNHISTRKGPKRVTSSEIATNKGTTKKRIYYTVEKRAQNKQRVARNPQQESKPRERAKRENSKESEGTERSLGFFYCLSAASCLRRQPSCLSETSKRKVEMLARWEWSVAKRVGANRSGLI